MTADKTRRLMIDDVMDVYTSWCQQRSIKPATRTMVGHAVKKYFKPIVRLKTKDHIRKYSYEGMMFRQDVSPIPEMTMLTHTENVKIRMIVAILEVQIRTKYVRDGEDVCVLASLNTVTNAVALNVHGKQLTQAFMIQNGLYPKDDMSQKFIDGLTRMVDNMKLCMGKPFQMTEESTVPEQHVWSIRTSLDDPELLRLHSKNCAVVLNFSTNYDTECCGNCVHDLG